MISWPLVAFITGSLTLAASPAVREAFAYIAGVALVTIGACAAIVEYFA